MDDGLPGDDNRTGPDSPAVRTSIPPDKQPSEAVISTVASVEGVDPTSLDILHDSIDPDELNGLINDSAGEVAVQFTYSGYAVTVRAEDTIILREIDESGSQ